jgi:23S rRNA C2498 (ribose-2'-O)-methylase RlmM
VAKARFHFNFTKAVQVQFEEQLKTQPQKPLANHEAPAEPGVYVLYRKGRPVYVGSATSGAKLSSRLKQHANKVGSRENISLDEMTCRFLAVDEDWMAVAAEKMMIDRYDPSWQGSGFGGHVPGRGRPGIRPIQWDEEFPPEK